MKRTRIAVCLFSMVLASALIEYKTMQAQAAERAQTQISATAAKPTLADFAWVTGRWSGLAGTSPTEQICSAPSNGLILCMFRVLDEKPQTVELATLRETAGGIEERVRNFTPELESWVGAAPITLKLESYTPTESIFINANAQSPVKRVFLWRNGADQMSTRVEVVDSQGKVSHFGAQSNRVK